MAYIDELARSAAITRRARHITEKPSFGYRVAFCAVVIGGWLMLLEAMLIVTSA